MEIPGFVISGPPRTKKTSSRIIQIPKKGGKKCAVCHHRPGFPKLIPSEAHEEWLKEAMAQAARIKAIFLRQGVALPLEGPVSVEALIYRDRLTGDACGFYQAIGDMLQTAGFIANDAQIEDWDGSRRLKDAKRPRIEIYLTLVSECYPASS